MTRINTNVSSLVAQNTLGRSNAALEQALTRLSTGLRINTGKDDPAGLIASENLRSDITSIKRAIGNTDRANQVIATADSALGQVSSLLNDIRGLVTEAANNGALSDDQIAANQLQIDSSLEALNRIAQTTTFQGRKLLDGSLDFITSAGTNFRPLSGLQIDQANLGATGSVAVAVDVIAAATQAQVDVDEHSGRDGGSQCHRQRLNVNEHGHASRLARFRHDRRATVTLHDPSGATPTMQTATAIEVLRWSTWYGVAERRATTHGQQQVDRDGRRSPAATTRRTTWPTRSTPGYRVHGLGRDGRGRHDCGHDR